MGARFCANGVLSSTSGEAVRGQGIQISRRQWRVRNPKPLAGRARERLADLLSEDLSREYQAIIPYIAPRLLRALGS
jgi:hypothetical protein